MTIKTIKDNPRFSEYVRDAQKEANLIGKVVFVLGSKSGWSPEFKIVSDTKDIKYQRYGKRWCIEQVLFPDHRRS